MLAFLCYDRASIHDRLFVCLNVILVILIQVTVFTQSSNETLIMSTMSQALY